MKTLSCLFLLVLLVSCGKSDKDNSCKASDIACHGDLSALNPADHDPYPGSLPSEAFTFDTNLTLIGFSADQEDKLLQAAELIQKVLATQEFKEAVLNHTYLGEKTFVNNNGLSNVQIYYKIIEGAERFFPTRNNAMDAEVELYYENTNTIGYTYENSKRIWMNTKYFNTYTPVKVSGNLFHEWCHKIGFGHSSSYNTARAYSVPYALGYLMERLSKELY